MIEKFVIYIFHFFHANRIFTSVDVTKDCLAVVNDVCFESIETAAQQLSVSGGTLALLQDLTLSAPVTITLNKNDNTNNNNTYVSIYINNHVLFYYYIPYIFLDETQ